MQYIVISDNDTLSSISKVVGSQNIDALLTENGLTRSPDIGKQWRQKCNTLLTELGSNPPDIDGTRKSVLLNTLTGSEELFEKACLMDESEWHIFSAFQSFADTLRIPETVVLPFSERVIGDSVSNAIAVSGTGVAVSGASAGRAAQNKYGNRNGTSNTQLPARSAGLPGSKYITSDASLGTYSGSNKQSAVTGKSVTSSSNSNAVDSVKYRAVINQLKRDIHIDPGIFNEINASPSVGVGSETTPAAELTTNPISWQLPWGKIQMYSSLLDKLIDIPVYPEDFDETRTASYTQMPEIIYQYEPWVTYQSSGPREQSLAFHLHRDLWTGDHRDGKAIELIRFCQANTFPRYNGSAVLAPTVKIYIAGKTFVSGVLTNTDVHWSGPIGLDDWPLEFTLTLSIQEVSEIVLNIDSVSKFGLVGGD